MRSHFFSLLLLFGLYAGVCRSICSKPSLFQCDDNTCISRARTCDNFRDCPNGEDESQDRAGCSYLRCKAKNATLAKENGYECRPPCIPGRNQCSGKRKCLCDDECGYSCITPGSTCPSQPPAIPNSNGYVIIRISTRRGRRVLQPRNVFKHRDMIKYQCVDGMFLEGPLVRCNARKRWTRQLPQCKTDFCARNECLNGGTCRNGIHRFTCVCPSTHTGERCEVEIYDLCENNPCLNGGTCRQVEFDRVECACPPGYSGYFCGKELFCSPPTPPDRGYILEEEKSKWRYGEEVTFQCLEDFRLYGRNLIRCGGDGTWTDMTAECRSSVCRLDYYLLPDVTVEGFDFERLYDHKFQVNDRVTLTCFEGYKPFLDDEPFSPSELQCSLGGRWTPDYSRITCEEVVACDIPGRIEGLILQATSDGTKIRVRCAEGFTLEGAETVICLKDGSWSDFPLCIPRVPPEVTCGDPDMPDELHHDGFPEKEQFQQGEVLNVRCSEGFFLVGQETIECRIDGTWSESPRCDEEVIEEPLREVVCENPVLPEELQHDGLPGNGEFQQGRVLNVHCSEGYILVGRETIECRSDGTWSKLPRCDEDAVQRGTCLFNFEDLRGGVEVELPGGGIMKDSYPFNATLGLFCEHRSKRPVTVRSTQFSTSSRCTEDGTWSPKIEDVDCVHICRRPSMPGNGRIIVNVQKRIYFPNETLFSTCPDLHRHAGSNKITCMDDGSWSEMAPCEPVGCWIDPNMVHKTVVFSGHNKASLTGVEFHKGVEMDVTCVNETLVLTTDLPPTIVCEGKNVWSQDYTQYACHGTCRNRCQQEDGPCACNFECEEAQNCCEDFEEYCMK